MPKSAVLPQVRVDPALRERAETALRPGESLSDLIESAVRQTIEYRAALRDFEDASTASRDHYLSTGESFSTDEVVASLRRRTDARRAALAKRGK